VYRKLLLIIFILVLIPVAFAYIPEGKYIWFNISPSTNSTLGGVIADECPVGQLPYAIFENGTFACKVP